MEHKHWWSLGQCVTGGDTSPDQQTPPHNTWETFYQRLSSMCRRQVGQHGAHWGESPTIFSFLFHSVSLSPSSRMSYLCFKTTSVRDVWLVLHSRAYTTQAGCSKASDASEHCVTLAVAAVVNVDLESWQLLRAQLVLSFPPDNRGLDNAWSLRQELNLPVCRSQINKTGKQWRGICCALDMIWMQDVFSISHSSDSWDFFFFFLVGGKGKADYTVTVCVCVTRQVYVCNCVNTEGVCMHLCTYIFCKVLTQQAMQADTAANIYALSSSKTLEGRWLVSCTCSVGIRFIMAVCFTLAAAL